MVEYDVNGVKVELDNTKKYLDFYREDGKGNLMQLNIEGLLEGIDAGTVQVDDTLKEYMQHLKRWVVEAPRKRTLREMRRSGMNVLTTDALFEQDGGEEIIDGLENSGVFAAYFLREVYKEN